MFWRELLLESRLASRAVEGLLNQPRPRPAPAAEFLSALVAVLSALAVAALACGVFMLLLRAYAAPWAVLLMAAVFGLGAVCAGALVAASRRVRGLRGRIVAHKVSAVIDAAAEELAGPVRACPKTAAALAALAGAAAGEAYGEEIGRKLSGIAASAKRA